LLREMLSESGFTVTLAINGRLALEILEEGRADLVLTDLMMPVLGGADLCRRLKAADATRAIPVILMSAVRPGAALSAGQDAFLRKPFDLAEVEALVGRYVGSTAPAPERA
jgi:CheY-like chemotaxis protein